MAMMYSKKHLSETEYIQVAKDYYAHRDEWLSMTNESQHLDMCACVSKRRKQLMFTGQSSCAVQSIPRLDPFEIRPHCIGESRRKTNDIIIWNFGKPDPHAKMVNGLLVTGPIRTICDLAKFDSTESLLVAINYCLFEKLFSKEQLAKVLNQHPRMKRKCLLERLIKLATPKCESPLETMAWIALYKAGFVMPQQQINIYGKFGKREFIGRVDMYWKLRSREIVLELDGNIKYTDRNILIEEKKREDKLRESGLEVIRADWRDVANGRLIEMLLRRKIPLRRNRNRQFPSKNK